MIVTITEFLPAAEIAELVMDQAVLSLGPWPLELELMVFVTKTEWRCGLNPATQISDASYRDGVLQIARELQKTIGARRTPSEDRRADRAER